MELSVVWHFLPFQSLELLGLMGSGVGRFCGLVPFSSFVILVIAGALWPAFRFSSRSRARGAAQDAVERLVREVALVRAPLDMTMVTLKKEARTYAEAQRAASLVTMPVESLKDIGVSGVRWTALQDGGVATLADIVTRTKEQLQTIPGVGATTAAAVLAAAKRVRDKIFQEPLALPLPDALDDAGRRMVSQAATVLRTREALAGVASSLEQTSQAFRTRLTPLLETSTFVGWWKQNQEQRAAILEAAQQLVKDVEAPEVTDLIRRAHEQRERLLTSTTSLSDAEILNDFRARYADYCAVIESALVGVAVAVPGEQERIEGWLPEEIARQVEGLTLRIEGMNVTLRRYQEFGAKYLVVQQKTILGDEMGLGKTIQALAAMVHLGTAERIARFLVVAPASILENWMREIRARTLLIPYLVHGPLRHRELLTWIEHGGVAVTSYETFRSTDMDGALSRRQIAVDFLVIDEAHYAKNPEASRSRAVKEMVPHARRVCLMTGTPLENRVDEFHALVRLLNPEIAAQLKLINYGFHRLGVERQRFHETVAPLYLRRNQEDVLCELPEKIEKEEWIELTDEDREVYNVAVRAKNMMAMRRAATLGNGTGQSAKLQRLGELFDEYRESEQKVLVFSFFLDVLEAVRQYVDAPYVITGAASPAERLRIVDEFGQAAGFRVLPCQIQAGGVGLNLQAASVVVLMEPQWKATAEDQAIARAYRMGQTRRVVVHRLLACNAVDVRLLEVLRGKQEIFTTFARDSLIKEASADATETQLAKVIIDAELERLQQEEQQSKL
ncbi:MAG: DEAD/DEAH box helicase [Candidatus Binatia bacterium]